MQSSIHYGMVQHMSKTGHGEFRVSKSTLYAKHKRGIFELVDFSASSR